MNKLKPQKYKPNSSENGLFTKLTKRCSTVSAKLMRKSPGRKSVSPQPISAGSYNMTGNLSEDHKLEIGAPILISKTIIDSEQWDSSGHLSLPTSNGNHTRNSSDSEVYADAVSSLPSVQDIKFEFYPAKDDKSSTLEAKYKLEQDDEGYYQTPKSDNTEKRTPPLRKNRSKSTQNLLHKTELKVFLQKAPSLELDLQSTTADLENCFDLPRKLNLSEGEPPNSPPATMSISKKPQSVSEPNTPSCPELATNFNLHHFKSAESLSNNTSTMRKSVVFSSSNSVKCRSRDSMAFDSSLEDFDMKSVSFQSLDAKNLFMSIEELNEITRQINESEEFNRDIDYEYCEHRDNLRPNERRITLLKNKNAPLINFDAKKEKLNNAWSGLKHWIGEERSRLKEVVQRHTAAQKVGPSSSNQTPKANGQMMGSRVSMNPNCRTRETSPRYDADVSYASSTLSTTAKTDSGHTMVGGGEDDTDFGVSDAESNFKSNQIEISPHTKKIKPKERLEGQNGFEELRRYIKQGGDFGKDLVAILQERVESEQLYAKSLSKMASKLNKACREIPGSVADAWRGVATEMETRSEVHRQFSTSLIEEIVKPLKVILDNQHKSRKSVESSVDKSSRFLSEWRASEAKAKKSSHTASRENEKLQDAMLDVRIQRSPSIVLLHQGNTNGTAKPVADKEVKSAEKDCAKLDNKRRKAEEAVKRADVEYYTLCIRSERARVDWEMSVLRGSSILQNLENQRLQGMKNYVTSYLRLTAEMNPVLCGLVERLTPQVDACNVQKDLIVVKNIRRAAEGPSEQLLPDFYCEHTTLAMNRERRKHALVKLLQLVRTDLDRERRSRNGLKGLSQSLTAHDNQNITDKLYHIRSMLTYLEGARFKLQSALLELDHKPRSSHPLAPHIQITRDRTGLQQSILKVPIWLKNDDKMNGDSKESEYDTESQTNSSCLDIKNETLIKHFDRNFNRSKSSSDLVLNGESILSNGKSHTMPVKDPDSPDCDRGQADGGSNQPDSDFDEFSSQDDEDELSRKDKLASVNGSSTDNLEQISSKQVVLSRCKALYSYTPKLYDELELTPGDIIEVHTKQEDGWWLGALKNQIGIFPATYVEEIV